MFEVDLIIIDLAGDILSVDVDVRSEAIAEDRVLMAVGVQMASSVVSDFFEVEGLCLQTSDMRGDDISLDLHAKTEKAIVHLLEPREIIRKGTEEYNLCQAGSDGFYTKL